MCTVNMVTQIQIHVYLSVLMHALIIVLWCARMLP